MIETKEEFERADSGIGRLLRKDYNDLSDELNGQATEAVAAVVK